MVRRSTSSVMPPPGVQGGSGGTADELTEAFFLLLRTSVLLSISIGIAAAAATPALPLPVRREYRSDTAGVLAAIVPVLQ